MPRREEFEKKGGKGCLVELAKAEEGFGAELFSKRKGEGGKEA